MKTAILWKSKKNMEFANCTIIFQIQTLKDIFYSFSLYIFMCRLLMKTHSTCVSNEYKYQIIVQLYE